jgi:competence protein ComEA
MKLLPFGLALFLLALSPSGWGSPVNINSADAATIARELKGIGLSKAEAIVQYRQKHGPFRSADELAQVRGIGQKTIENNRANIRIDRTVGPPGAAAGATPAPAARPAKPTSGR